MSPGSWAGVPAAWKGRSPEAWARRLGVPLLELHGRLPSTSCRLRELVSKGVAPMTAIVAGAQTEGRGRGGTRWHSADDSGLWISLLLPVEPAGMSGAVPLAVGVATARALERAGGGGASVALKWPNDLLIGDRKVAGILCEAVALGPERVGGGVIVGIGVNLRLPRGGLPPDLLSAAAFLEEVRGRDVTEPELARVLVEELQRWAHPAPSALSPGLREEWEARDRLRGARVLCDRGVTGMARGISADGGLEVACPGGVVVVRSGSVRLAAPGASPALHSTSTLES